MIRKKLNDTQQYNQIPCYRRLGGGDCRVARSLDPCSKDPEVETTFRPVKKGEERISQLSEKKKKKAKGITRCGHIDRKGRTTGLVYLFSGPFVL